MRSIRACFWAAAAFAISAPVHAEWYRASSDHFLIYSQQKPQVLLGFASELEFFDQAVRLIRGMNDKPPSKGNRLTIFDVGITKVQRLVHDDKGFIAGYYHGDVGGSVAFVSRSNPIDFQVHTGELTPKINNMEFARDTVLLHEYSHHLMMQDLSRPYPEWLVEGFAEFMSAAEFNPDGSIEIGRQPTYRYAGLLYGDQLPLETLLSGHFDKLTPEQMESLYGRGWLLTHYLTFEPSRKGQLDAYIAAIAKGVAPLDAARQSFGDLAQLQHDLDGYFARSKLFALHIPAKDLKKVSIDITKLSPGAEAVLPVLMHLRSGTDEKYDELAAQAQKVEQQFAGDALVETTLSEAELDAKDWKAAEAAADRALAADPSSTDAMILKGRARIKELASSKASAADFDDARTRFLKANKIDPEDPEPLYRFYDSFIEEKVPPTKNAIDALHYASDLAPQDLGVRIQSAQQYVADGDLKDARAALVPVAYDPHGEELTKRARAMIEKIDAGDAKAALAVAEAPSDGKSKAN